MKSLLAEFEQRIPLLEKEGWLRQKERESVPKWRRRGGQDRRSFQECLLRNSANLTTPSAPSAVASQHSIDGASTPPSQGGEHTAQVAAEHVVAPAMRAAEGLPRLRALVRNWLGWTARAGLAGGCPIAAGIFELDDTEGPVREQLLQMEKSWRALLAQHVAQAVDLGHLRRDLDIEQFVWELCGIYLSHHAFLRFVRDPRADKRARIAFDALLERALPKDTKKKKAALRRVR